MATRAGKQRHNIEKMVNNSKWIKISGSNSITGNSKLLFFISCRTGGMALPEIRYLDVFESYNS